MLNSNELILKYIEHNQFGKWIGMNFQIVDKGVVKYTLTIDHNHLATPNAAHGGVISSLLDATIGVGALSAVCHENKVVATVNLQVQFFMPALIGDELIATSTLIKKGNRLIFMEATVRKGTDTVAKATATLNAYNREKAGY
jgi:uncharacterized protein (TIGR00369 family)